MKHRHTRALVAVIFALAAAQASATDGYFANGYGTNYKAMGGAGVALYLGTQAPATNPASMAFLGRRFDIGVEAFNPNRQFTVNGAPSGFPGTFGLAPGTVKSGSRYFPVPAMGANWTVGENGAFGVAAYGNGGMNTNYAASVFGAGETGVDLSQMFLAPTFSYKLDSRNALGVSAILAYQRFEAKGLLGFSQMSTDPSKLTNLDHANSYGAGFKVGYLAQYSDRFSLGLSYQSRIWMTPFDDYAGLFADKGDFDIPQTFTGGVGIKPSDKLTVALDVQWINYESIKSVSNDFLPNLGMARLGMAEGAGFGWHDMTIYKGGLQYEANENWIMRAGYSYGKEPIRNDEVLINILAPGVMEHHITAGFTRNLGNGRALNIAIVRAIPKSVSGPNNLEVPNRQFIDLKMDQWEVDFSYTFGVRK
jgi:long-chain fatty acid transport protein